MSDTLAVPTAVDSVLDDSTDTVYDKGSWQSTLQRAGSLFDKSAGERKRATALLWTGAQSGIEDWLPNASDDVNAENLYSEVIGILGKSRKGDASKIKTVALAVKNHGLVVSVYPNLSKAYAEARRLTQTVAQEKSEDAAADKAVEAAAANAPKSSSTPEGAALILIAQGMDELARLLLDALGATNDAAHRALMRAISQEIAGRVKPKASAAKAGPKAGATQAKAPKPGSTPKAAAPAASTKAKQAAPAAPVAVAKPVVPVKGKPVAVKGKPVAVKPKSA